MKKSTFSEEQIAYALRQVDGGTLVGDVCRQLGVSDATFYVWKKKYGKLDVSEMREIRQLRDGNARLKRQVADLTLDRHILSKVIKKSLKPARRRQLVTWIQATFQISTVRSCRLAQFARAAWYRRSTAQDQSALALRTPDIAHARPRFGYQRITAMLRREGWPVNPKRVHRVYVCRVCKCGCGYAGASTCACTAGRRRWRRARMSGGVWTLRTMPCSTDDRFGW